MSAVGGDAFHSTTEATLCLNAAHRPSMFQMAFQGAMTVSFPLSNRCIDVEALYVATMLSAPLTLDPFDRLHFYRECCQLFDSAARWI